MNYGYANQNKWKHECEDCENLVQYKWMQCEECRCEE
jgi:hypothetical protein